MQWREILVEIMARWYSGGKVLKVAHVAVAHVAVARTKKVSKLGLIGNRTSKVRI